VLGLNTWLVAGEAVQNLNFAGPVSTLMTVITGGVAADPLKAVAMGGGTGTANPSPGTTRPGTGTAPATPGGQPSAGGTVPDLPSPPLPAAGQWSAPRGDLANRAAVTGGPGAKPTSLWSNSRDTFDARLTLTKEVLYAAGLAPRSRPSPPLTVPYTWPSGTRPCTRESPTAVPSGTRPSAPRRRPCWWMTSSSWAIWRATSTR